MNSFEFSSWVNGVVLDRWSLIHFFYGVIFALLFRMVRLSRARAYALAFVIMIGWEFYERTNKVITESPTNSILDVVVASLGFWLVYRFFPTYRFGRDSALSFGFGTLVLILMMVSG